MTTIREEMMARRLTVLDVCSGIGGFTLGLEKTGFFRTVGFSEIDPFCLRVLERRWPHVPRLGALQEAAYSDALLQIGHVNVLAGGVPCQPHSYNGKRKGAADERDLWKDFYALIGILGPEWVILENVPGFLSSGAERGDYFGSVLRDLAEIGYDAEWQVLSAAAFGADHRRERVWLVAYPSGIGVERVWPERFQISQPLDRSLLSLRDSNGQWKVEPDVCRVDDGVPDRAHRLKALGNAVVPMAVQYIGYLIAVEWERMITKFSRAHFLPEYPYGFTAIEKED